MKLACVQMAPREGEIEYNMARAEKELRAVANTQQLDILLLPALALSGMARPDVGSVAVDSPCVEPPGGRFTSLWTRTAAQKYGCLVATGYAEARGAIAPKAPEPCDSVIMVGPRGDALLTSQKAFHQTFVPGIGEIVVSNCEPPPLRTRRMTLKRGLGVNDREPLYRLACFVRETQPRVVLLPMSWITSMDAYEFSCAPLEPDRLALDSWIRNLQPLVASNNGREVIFVFANRAGSAQGTFYAGTSAIVGIARGEVHVYGVLGRAGKELLVADVSQPGMLPASGYGVPSNTCAGKDRAEVSSGKAPRRPMGPPLTIPSTDGGTTPREVHVATPYPSTDARRQGRVFGDTIFAPTPVVGSRFAGDTPSTAFDDLSPELLSADATLGTSMLGAGCRGLGSDDCMCGAF
ncbi:protein N-terminal amidase [Apiospora arundinis]|uniref:Protein N-terminal amidase n=1 Tax=Apiospora arundinis TaxID=335852 RepID=A0ABR2I901_9PEZI